MLVEKKVVIFIYILGGYIENYILRAFWVLNVYGLVLGWFFYCFGILVWVDLFNCFYEYFLFFLWLVSFLCLFRYGEKNNAFIVVSFENEDENKDEIFKKVSRVLDKVIFDYYLGFFFLDEDISKEVDVKFSLVAVILSFVY